MAQKSDSAGRWAAAVCAVAAVLLLAPAPARGVTPESPEVQELVKKGLGYLAEHSHRELGGKCLSGLAYLKTEPPQPNHPRVKEALAACRKPPPRARLDMYSHGLAIIFLCELDHRAHGDLIRGFLGSLKKRQKNHGGWGYDDKPTGDTSQSQYAALSYWEAHKYGFGIESSSTEELGNWLMSTQDPSGAWGYQGKVADGNELVEQHEITCSMVSAAMGSSLIVADLFGLLDPGAGTKQGPRRPAAMRLKGQDEDRSAPKLRSATLNRKRLFGAIERGNSWMAENYKENIGRYNIYYLYALERYKSFQEKLDGNSPREPDWYNKGYEYLKSKQAGDGSWSAGCEQVPDTAFAILFLIRSTRRMLDESYGDLQLARKGLPPLTKGVKIKDGELAIEQTEAAIGNLLGLMDDETSDAIDQIADNPDAFQFVGEIDEAGAQRLRQVVRGGSPGARLVATRTLGRTGDLDHVPTLIYALTDPDRRVTLAARDALRFISRRFEGFGLEDDYTDRTRFAAVDRWKQWYLSIRPTATVSTP